MDSQYCVLCSVSGLLEAFKFDSAVRAELLAQADELHEAGKLWSNPEVESYLVEIQCI